MAQPDTSVPTVGIFSAPDLTRDSSYITIADFLASPTFSFGKNDLEPVVHRLYPEVLRATRWLSEQGIPVRMSGSGACLFAEFSELSEAVLAKAEISAIMRGAVETNNATHPGFRLVQACAGLTEHPLRNWIAR